MNDFLIFKKKPKLKVGDSIREIDADNGHFVFHYNAIVKEIEKIKDGYKIILEEK